LFKVKASFQLLVLVLKFEGTAGNFEQESTGYLPILEELTLILQKWLPIMLDFMVFIFDNGTAGDGSANSTYYFDDVKQASIPVCAIY
jgi:hypothetical protein